MRRIGLMGGTFDPIHLGHLILAETARDELSLDGILFMPTGCSYLKDGKQVADREDRYRMTELAIRDHPGFTLSRMEIDRPGNTYTADTLAQLHREDPDVEWFLITGADAFLMMEHWVRPEEIFALCTVACTVRGSDDRGRLEEAGKTYAERFQAKTALFPLMRMDISSTEIRGRLRTGKSVRYLLPGPVIEYIREKGLYQT